MKSILFDNSFELEPISLFLSELNDITLDEDDEPLYVYFTSSGGRADYLAMLLHYFENYHYKDNIILVPLDCLNSCAFEFFIKANVQKEFIYETSCLLHSLDLALSYRELTDNSSSSFVNKKVMDKMVKDREKFYINIGLTKKELKVIKEGHDLTINIKRLKELTKNAEKINL